MKQTLYTVCSNEPLARQVFRMRLLGDTSAITAPGQFVDLALPGFFLRRPISICDYDADGLTIIYKVVGKGTAALSRLAPGAELDALSGLGNGFDTQKSGESPLLIGGGVGVPPLYALAKRLLAEGKCPTAILGFNKADEVFYAGEFENLGVRTIVCTADGSVGVRGFVTDAIATLSGYSFYYACGPEPMLRAVHALCPCGGQLSFEERMGCGFGACMGCSCKTKYGNKRICKDGPVLDKEEIVW